MHSPYQIVRHVRVRQPGPGLSPLDCFEMVKRHGRAYYQCNGELLTQRILERAVAAGRIHRLKVPIVIGRDETLYLNEGKVVRLIAFDALPPSTENGGH